MCKEEKENVAFLMLVEVLQSDQFLNDWFASFQFVAKAREILPHERKCKNFYAGLNSIHLQDMNKKRKSFSSLSDDIRLQMNTRRRGGGQMTRTL